ncbi:MAG: PP2C family serine/threonine-protein phosphatase [Fuerstiella sp.]
MGSTLEHQRLCDVTAAGAVSRCGARRQNNQDAFIADEDLAMYVVADGIGSLAGGEVASAIACCEIISLQEHSIDWHNVDSDSGRHAAIRSAIRDCFRAADKRIVCEQSMGPFWSRMGTTALLAYVDVEHDDSPATSPTYRLYVGNVGACRALLVRDGEVSQLTHDHTLAFGLREAGVISEEQAIRHPGCNELYMYLGGAICDGPEIYSCPASYGDRVILMTDGITRVLDNQQVVELVSSVADVDAAASILADEAVEHGAGDDVTCVVIDIQD